MTRLPISVCMISGAEAHRIGRALESVADWTSETIIVLNEDIRDGTEELALRHGAKVFREPWKGFVDQKDSAAAKATQPWLLNLDADEVVSPDLQREICHAIGQTASAHVAFEFPRCTFFYGRWIRHGDWYPDRVLRLWKRGAAHWTGEDPHAHLEVGGSIGRLRADLLHLPAETFDRLLTKTAAYAETFAGQCVERQRRFSAADLLVRPSWRFVRGYCLRLGFLDGWQGLYIAWMGAFYTVLRYAKALEVQRHSRMT
jgi:glycosyltransferase involved in cell wall biosynthesis